MCDFNKYACEARAGHRGIYRDRKLQPGNCYNNIVESFDFVYWVIYLFISISIVPSRCKVEFFMFFPLSTREQAGQFLKLNRPRMGGP